MTEQERERIIDEFTTTADEVDRMENKRDLLFIEAIVLADNYEKTGNVWELIRLAYNMGYYRRELNHAG